MRHALINLHTEAVVNVVVLEGNAPVWPCPPDHIAVPSDEAGPGWHYAKGAFIEPEQPGQLEHDESEPIGPRDEKIAALEARIEAIEAATKTAR